MSNPVRDQLIEAIRTRIARNGAVAEIIDEDAHAGGASHMRADRRTNGAVEKFADAIIKTVGAEGAITALGEMDDTQIAAQLEAAMHHRPVGVAAKG